MTASPNVTPAATTSNAGFNRWITDFRRRALAQGIRADIFDQAFRNVQYLNSVIEADRNQAEFVKALWDYLDSAVSTTRIRNGQGFALRMRAASRPLMRSRPTTTAAPSAATGPTGSTWPS